ncbi:MAG: fused MFS/spermidine synthase [Xanthomonadales bacterium]|nr:fused MFS/spermidine synthase [Xanthomonadales bacterium]
MRASLVAGIAAGLVALLSLATSGCARDADPNRGDIVHRQKSMYRDIIVLDTDTHRCMSFARRGGMQSCILKDAPNLLAIPYTRAVFAGLVANPDARRVLVIGLGGGVISTAMRRMDPSIRIDVVELDPAVVEVAKTYFGYREDARLKTYIGDGRVFVRRQARAGIRYDLVVIDAYERVYVPEHLMSREFIEEVKSLLAPGGVVASNTFARGPLAPYEAATYQSVFADTRVVDMSMGNRIILAGRDGLPPATTIRDSAGKLEGRFHEIGIFVRELESHPQPKIEGYRPLTDQYAPANLLFGE